MKLILLTSFVLCSKTACVFKCVDVSVGGYLSGGIDSSLVCSLASSVLGASLPMFHGRFTEGPQYDESEYVRSLSEFSRAITMK